MKRDRNSKRRNAGGNNRRREDNNGGRSKKGQFRGRSSVSVEQMAAEDEAIRAAFEKFYGAHRDTKVDFIIRIDPEKNKYELALYRYGLQEPVAISEDTYQMIVFKSKFEYYRSENYDQPRGAWIW